MKVDKWTIWLADLEPVVGSEQGMIRPVLVISETSRNDVLRVVNVLPITSRKPGRRIYPNEAGLPNGTAGLRFDSIVLCYQVRTLDKQRLQKQFGTLTDPQLMEEVLTALCFQLGIKR